MEINENQEMDKLVEHFPESCNLGDLDSNNVDFAATKRGVYGSRLKGKSLFNASQHTDFPSWDGLKINTSAARLKGNSTAALVPSSPDLVGSTMTSDDYQQQNSKGDSSQEILLPRINSDVTKERLVKSKQRNRRCSDTALLSGFRKSDYNNLEFNRKKTHKSSCPSQYKVKRRGTYAAVYDPQVTVRKQNARSKSLFIKADDILIDRNNGVNTLTNENSFISNGSTIKNSNNSSNRNNNKIYNPTFRVRHRSLENSPVVSRSSVNWGINLSNNGHGRGTVKRWNSFTGLNDSPSVGRKFMKDSNNDLMDRFTQQRQRFRSLENIHDEVLLTPSTARKMSYFVDEDAKHIINRTYRAMSSFDGLSKEHLDHIERKYEKAKKQAHSICSKSPNLSQSSDESNEYFNDARSEIHYAVETGDLERLKQLINDGHDVNSVDQKGRLPCDYALMYGYFDCLALLIQSGANLRDYFERRREKYFRTHPN